MPLSGHRWTPLRCCSPNRNFLCAGRMAWQAQKDQERVKEESNPHQGTTATWEGLLADESRALESARREASRWGREAEWLKEVDVAFSRTGVQSFALEGILGELQVRRSLRTVRTCCGQSVNAELFLLRRRALLRFWSS